MTRITRRSLIVFLAIVLLALSLPFTSVGQSKFVTRRGQQLIAPDGKPLLLKGINLGNWLLPEGYMFKFKTANSPRMIQSVVNELIGEDGARRFWRAFSGKLHHEGRHQVHQTIRFQLCSRTL